MPHYKLTYFPIKVRAETARQIFAVAGIPFEDVRISHDQWPKLKPKTQFGQLPMLEFDGVELAQSEAINRFLARQFGLAGKGHVEEALVDSYAELFRDYREEIKSFYLLLAGSSKNGDKDEIYREKVIPARDKFFETLRRILSKSGSGFLAPSGLTYVDLAIAEHLDQFLAKLPNYAQGYPEITVYVDRVQSNPGLKRWLETRPHTDF